MGDRYCAGIVPVHFLFGLGVLSNWYFSYWLESNFNNNDNGIEKTTQEQKISTHYHWKVEILPVKSTLSYFFIITYNVTLLHYSQAMFINLIEY